MHIAYLCNTIFFAFSQVNYHHGTEGHQQFIQEDWTQNPMPSLLEAIFQPQGSPGSSGRKARFHHKIPKPMPPLLEAIFQPQGAKCTSGRKTQEG